MNRQNVEWASAVLCAIERKIRASLKRNPGIIPYTSAGGRFDDWSDDERISGWTNGFWPGILWQMHALTGDESYKDGARKPEGRMRSCFQSYEALDHDVGFRWLLTSVADYRVTGDRRAREDGLIAATVLLGRLNLRAGLIRAWNSGPEGDNRGRAIIDTMMNLPLLHWASGELGDDRFSQAANLHAKTASSAFLRPDGSVSHIVTFDHSSGLQTGAQGGQGMAVGSSWTRGQAWAMYGFHLQYMHTGLETYRLIAEKISGRFLERLSKWDFMPVDFDQPDDCPFEDDSAMAIASSALLLMGKEEEAVRMLRCLIGRADLSEDTDGIVLNCSAKYHEPSHNYPLIYADYFLIEALMRLSGKEVFLW